MGTARYSIKVLTIFALTLSLASLPGPLSLDGRGLPRFRLAHGAASPIEAWYPAGPEMDTLTYPIFTDQTAEFIALQAPVPAVDFTDWPLDPALVGPLTAGAGFQVTAPIAEAGYSELEFHLGQIFWGCPMAYGASACGREIRQAFAHGLDKTAFAAAMVSPTPLDNPMPPSVAFNTPDPCGWDSANPQGGPTCIVNGPGGTAYHLAAAAPGIACGGAPGLPPVPWIPGCGTPDFCAAAAHLVAAGLAAAVGAGTCVLAGVVPAVAAAPIVIYVRSDDSLLLNAGNSYAEFVCALFVGAFTVGCPGVTVVHGPISGFPGFNTSPVAVPLTWWVYTAGFSNMLTFDSSLYLVYNSRFVSGIGAIKPACAAESLPSFSAANYMYLCSAAFDTQSSAAEYSPCLTSAGDPVTGQVNHPGVGTTLTFANCPTTTQLTSASAAYKAEDVFGQNAFTIPLYSRSSNQFAYLAGWSRGVLHKGDGFTPPGNFFMTLNAWNPAAPVPGTIRQGYKQTTGSVNPFTGRTAWDLGVIESVWDTLGRTNPAAPVALFDWMTVKSELLLPSQIAWTVPVGTIGAFRFTLRNDIYFHTGQPLTAWDVVFSYLAYATAGVNGGSLAPMIGMKVVSRQQVDIYVNALGPFTKGMLMGAFQPTGDPLVILPARNWVDPAICSANVWDLAVSTPNFQTANNVLTACIATPASVTPAGVLQKVVTPAGAVFQANVDPVKIAPTYDPVSAGNLIGSGPWMCKSGNTIGGPGCSSNGTQSPPAGGSWTLTRFGLGTTAPGQTYFRSPSALALWIWSQDRGTFANDFLFNLAVVGYTCYGKPLGTPGCGVWQHGIGNPFAFPIGITQYSIVLRFVGVAWIAPYDWSASPPQNIGPFPPVLYEGGVTLNPSTIAGCAVEYSVGGGYDC